MNIIEYADREMLTMRLADQLASELRIALLNRDFVSLAVPGGTTPGPIFDMLSGIDLQWDRVHVMLTDERWVPEDHGESNARLVRERLLTDRAAAAHFLPYYRDGLTAAEGADAADDVIARELPLSLLVLGMGADMHTASLFPGADGLQEAMAVDAPHLCAIRPEGHDIDRVTLPARVLKGAMSTHLVIFGAEKRAALEKAQSLAPEKAPIAAVLGGGTVHWAE